MGRLWAVFASLLLVVVACAPAPVPQTTEAEGLAVNGPGAQAALVAGNSAPGARLDAPASLDVVFNDETKRKTQALAGATYEIRAMYTEAVVR
jgi:hypothetical protein